jgi:hypothetical protein
MARKTEKKNIGKFKSSIYTALVNYPSLNRSGDIVTTSITPLSIHDIARASATYNAKKYFVVNPVNSQKRLIKRIIEYWNNGFGSLYNTNRKIALKTIKPVNNLTEAFRWIEKEEKRMPEIVVSSAKHFPNTISFKELRKKIFDEDKIFLLLFGTGWGLPDEIIMESDYILEAINGYSTFNHLSVRSAAAIILDRLLCMEE